MEFSDAGTQATHYRWTLLSLIMPKVWEEENMGYQPGGNGKIAAAITLFCKDWKKSMVTIGSIAVYTKEVKGNEFVVSDHHCSFI
jgi:hypothetical protein